MENEKIEVKTDDNGTYSVYENGSLIVSNLKNEELLKYLLNMCNTLLTFKDEAESVLKKLQKIL